MILCGQRSLEIFALGVALAFTGYFVLRELDAGLVRCMSWSAFAGS